MIQMRSSSSSSRRKARFGRIGRPAFLRVHHPRPLCALHLASVELESTLCPDGVATRTVIPPYRAGFRFRPVLSLVSSEAMRPKHPGRHGGFGWGTFRTLKVASSFGVEGGHVNERRGGDGGGQRFKQFQKRRTVTRPRSRNAAKTFSELRLMKRSELICQRS